MAYVSQRLALKTGVFIVSAVFHEAVTLPLSFQPTHRAVPVLA